MAKTTQVEENMAPSWARNSNVMNCCGGLDVSPPLLMSLFVRTNPISPRCGESTSPPRRRGGGSKAPVQHSDFRKHRLKSLYPAEGTLNQKKKKITMKYVQKVPLFFPFTPPSVFK